MIADEEPETVVQPQVSVNSEVPEDAGDGSSLRPRKRQRGEGSSNRDPGPSQPPEEVIADPAEETLPQPGNLQDPILIGFNEGDTAQDPAVAERLNRVAVLPADAELCGSVTFPTLIDAFMSNMALVSNFP